MEDMAMKINVRKAFRKISEVKTCVMFTISVSTLWHYIGKVLLNLSDTIFCHV